VCKKACYSPARSTRSDSPAVPLCFPYPLTLPGSTTIPASYVPLGCVYCPAFPAIFGFRSVWVQCGADNASLQQTGRKKEVRNEKRDYLSACLSARVCGLYIESCLREESVWERNRKGKETAKERSIEAERNIDDRYQTTCACHRRKTGIRVTAGLFDSSVLSVRRSTSPTSLIA